MESNAIQIVVRVRPWDVEKELPLLAQPSAGPYFLGDGGFANSPRKPVPPGSLREVVDVIDHRVLLFDKPDDGPRRGQPPARRSKNRRYVFDQVLNMQTIQEKVFEKTVLPLLEGVMNGYNSTVFAYGATGCGKTYTISGTPEQPGIIIRTMRELFSRIDADEGYDTFLELSMVEIYNEKIRDLLSDKAFPEPVGGLKLLENEKEKITIDKVTLHRPTSVDEVMELIMLGNQRRSTSFTQSNSVSSRSHAVLQINVGRSCKTNQVDLEQGTVKQAMTSATLSIIDLAGSERAAATTNMGARMKEGANINKSLLALGSCINALCARPAAGSKTHVPYRDSKLTRLLKFSLGGNCRTVMVVCVSPSSRDIEDTHNTLVWADRAKNVTTKVTQNTTGVDMRLQGWLETIRTQNLELESLRREIDVLKAGQKEFEEKKKQLQWAEVLRALEAMKADADRYIMSIIEGAARRAEWDGAVMAMGEISKRMKDADSDAELRAYLETLRKELDAQWSGNSSVIAAVHKGTADRNTVEALFRGIESRKFGDVLAQADREVFRLRLALQKSELERRVLEAKEKACRAIVQLQARTVAGAAASLFTLSTSLQAQTTRLASVSGTGVPLDTVQLVTDSLRNISDATESALSDLSNGRLDPASIASLTDIDMPHDPPHILASPFISRFSSVAAPTGQLGAPARRDPVVPSQNPFAAPGSHASPVAKRILHRGKAAEARVHVASPRRKVSRVSIGVAKMKGSTPKKAAKIARFKDDSSIAAVRFYDIITSASESSPGTHTGEGDVSSNGDTSAEWAEGDNLLPLPIKPISSIPRKRASMLPIPTASRPSISPPSESSSSGSDTKADPASGWRANRALLKAQIPLHLSAIGEEESMEAGPSRKPGAMGPPSRPVPLGERIDNPPAPNASMSALTSFSTASNLYKPTAASALRSVNSVALLGIGRSRSPPKPDGLAGPSNRRVSSIGPQRTARNKSNRHSMVAAHSGGSGGKDISMSAASVRSLAFASAGPASASAPSGPHRVSDTSLSSATGSESRIQRRVSTIVLPSFGSIGGNGPSPSNGISASSMGMPRGPFGLSSRPSMSRLTGSAGTVGDGSMRAAWR